jgi:hypothetical protein
MADVCFNAAHINRAGLGKYWFSVLQTDLGFSAASGCIRTERLIVAKPDAC